MTEIEKEEPRIYTSTPGRSYQQSILFGQKQEELFVSRVNLPKPKPQVKPKSRRRGPH